MADACSMRYQPVLEKVEDFLRTINELTNENKGRLRKLGEISEVAASIGKEKGEAKETPIVDRCEALVKNICNTLLLEDDSYTVLVTILAEIFSMVKEMENKQKEEESFKLPKPMQNRVDAVNSYLEKAKGRLKKIDNTLSDLTPKIKKAKNKQFRVSDEEIADLEMDAEDVKLALDACKKYLNSAELEINLLESDINSEIRSYQLKTAATFTAVAAGVMIAGVVFGPKEILELSIKELAQKIATAKGGLAVGATVVGATSLYLHVVSIICNRKKQLTSDLDILKTELRKVKTDFEVAKRDFDGTVTGRMK